MTPNATTIVFNNIDLLTIESFAAKVEHLDVSALPGNAVYIAASEINRSGTTDLSVLANCESWTVYRVTLKGASTPQTTLLLEAKTGRDFDLFDVANVEDDRKQWLAEFPLLVGILNDLAS